MTELERIDQALSAQLDILRHSAHVEANIMLLLEQMRKELIQKLATANLTNWSKARLNQLLRDSEALIASYYTTAQATLAPTYNVVAGVAASQAGVAIPGGAVNVTLSELDADRNLRLYLVDVQRFDKAFAKDPSFYIGPDGEGGIGKRYENVAEYINTNKAMEASTVYVRPDGYVGFINGRHRYAYLRDAGVTKIPVALDEEAATNAAKAGYLVGQGSTAIVPAVAASIPSRTTLESIASNVMIDGATTKTWWGKIAADTAFKFKAAVRQGLMQGETQAQIFKRVNGVVGLAGRNSVALVHTSIMQTMNDATEATLQKNADVTPTVRHLATLDSSTCIVCGSRDGLEWDTLTKEPVGHDLPYITPPLHFGCRCKLVGVTKLSKLVNGQRASMFGPVDRKVTFNDFLGRQTPAFQNEVLGKWRAALYRSGKLTLRDLVSGTGAPLSLEQLGSKYEK